MESFEVPNAIETIETNLGSDDHGPLSGEEIDSMLAEMDEQAIIDEREMLRELEEARRPKWWTFGIRTFVP